jgi:hypothetical protein
MSNRISIASEIHPLPDSFVQGAIDAWAQNQHFVIRPADVWFTILTQMNFYLSSHQDSTEVRNHIEYKHSIEFTRSEFSFVWNPVLMVQRETQARVKSNATYEWIQPTFGESSPITSTEDSMTANLLIIGSVNSSSSRYSPPSSTQLATSSHPSSACGMPSITLLGTQKDWQQLLQKLDRMRDFGSQPADYSNKLRPILSRFVKSFEDPNSGDVRQFWNQIVTDDAQGRGCSKGTFITGWINGFHYWNPSGSVLSYNPGTNPDQRGSGSVSLDSVVYGSRSISDLPDAYPTILVRAPDFYHPNCSEDYGDLVAGMMGKKVTSGVPDGYTMALRKVNLALPSATTNDQHSILQPFSRWIFPARESYVADGGKRCK